MKRITLKTVEAFAALALLVLASHVTGQEASTTTQMTGNELLAEVSSETNQIPLNLYPVDYFDWLEALGTNYVPAPNTKTARPVRAQPVGQLVEPKIIRAGGFQSMAMNPSPNDPSSEYDYMLVDLGTVGGNYSWAYGINNNGQVTGLGTTAGETGYRAFLYQNGQMHILGTLGGGSSYDFGGLNANGLMVGSSQDSANNLHAFSYSLGGTMQDLGTLGLNGANSTSGANAVNASGTIVGVSDNHAFEYVNGTMTDLGTFSEETTEISSANAIDDYGDIAGSAQKSGNGHAFRLMDGMMDDLGTLGGNSSTAYNMNMYAEVVGQADITGSGAYHAFFYDTSMQDLGVLPGDIYSVAYGMNNAAHIVGTSTSGNPMRAFLVSNGSMKDLNAITINASGWTLQVAYAINDKEQIVGWGTDPNGHTHAFLLNPLPLGWHNAIATTPPQPIYGNSPTIESGKDSLVVVTHGWNQRYPLVGSPPTSIQWLDDMVDGINTYLSEHSLNNWQVAKYEWFQNSWTYTPNDALNNAKQEGKNLGYSIALQGWTHVHLIAHSAGAALIQSACEKIKDLAPSTVVHCTFLDAYIGTDYSGLTSYGYRSDWSDNYSTHDGLTGGELWPLTEGSYTYAYNVDVTYLDPHKVGSTKFYSSQAGQMEPCYKTLSSHDWPHDFYQKTITGPVSPDYAGFGFPLSEEGGNWSYALANYAKGNTIPQPLGTPDPTCTTDVKITPPAYPNTVPDFTQWPSVESDTGTVQKYIDHLNLLSGSPAWIATVVTTTNPVNVVSFDAMFTSSAGSQGVLTVLWDSETIGTLDERIITGLQHYQFTFPNALANTPHILGFRLDPFTNIQSTITLTNVVLNQIGPKQPFSLTMTTNASVGGAFVWQLTGEAGYTYSIQASSDLINWINIASLGNTNGTVLFYEQNSTNYPVRFYRGATP